jgi:hypothetical protein
MYKIDYQHHLKGIKQYKKDMQNIRHKETGKMLDPYMDFFRGEGNYEVYDGRLMKQQRCCSVKWDCPFFDLLMLLRYKDRDGR